MNVEKVIFEFNPPTKSERLKAGIFAFCLVFIASWCVTTWKISAGFTLIIWLLTHIAIWLRSSFDAWSIVEHSIILTRENFTCNPKRVELKFNEIISLKYFKPVPKRPVGVEFKAKNKTYFVRNGLDIFELADTLKYLKSKGINIELVDSDHEIELYLNDKIESIPITNKY